MTAPLVVIDTGVVFRALRGSPHGHSARVVEAAGVGHVRPVLSFDCLAELREVVRRKEGEIKSPARALDAGLHLWQHGTYVENVYRYSWWPAVNDEDDWWMLDLAYASTADYIVSVDPHLLRPARRIPLPVEVVTPTRLLGKLAM